MKQQLAGLFSIVCLTVLQVEANFRSSEYVRNNPYVVVIDSDLVSVSKNQSHIDVTSVNDSIKPCSIEIDQITDDIRYEIRAAAFGNGQKMVVWGVRNIGIGSTINIHYTILVIDPHRCSYQAVSIPEEKRPKSFPTLSIQVLLYYDTFDVFFPSQHVCSPCRFSDQGAKIALDYQLHTGNAVPSNAGFFIQAFNSSNLSQGFFYAYNFDNNTAVMKLLDDQFGLLKQTYVNHTVNAISLEAVYLPMIAICYVTPSVSNAVLLGKGQHQQIHCERLDSALKPLYSSSLPISEDYFVPGLYGFSLRVDSFGNCYVVVGQLPLLDDDVDTQLRFFHLDSTGRIDESLDLDDKIIGDRILWELYDYLVANQYCFVTQVPKNLKNSEYRQIINCINLPVANNL